MWFKQITCDKCFNPLENVGRHNRYIYIAITDFKSMSCNYFSLNDFSRYGKVFQFVFLSCNEYKPDGHIFMYQADYTKTGYSFFCSNECAYNFGKENNCLMFYYDEQLSSKRAISPEMTQINKELGGNAFRGLVTNFPDQWILPKSSFEDLRLYNTALTFPNVQHPYALTLFKQQDKVKYRELLYDKDFQLYFYGSNALPEEKINTLDKHIKSIDIQFSRRMEIEFIIRENANFIGFVRLACTRQDDPYNWYIEFGLLREKRRQGIMSFVIDAVFRWCKNNGLEKLYAACEIFNIATHKLICNSIVPARVNSFELPAFDEFAGLRKQYKFEIFL